MGSGERERERALAERARAPCSIVRRGCARPRRRLPAPAASLPPLSPHLTLVAWRLEAGTPAPGAGNHPCYAPPTLSRSLTLPRTLSPLPIPARSSYLAELLLDKGYIVHGLKRRASSYNHPRLEHIMDASEFGGRCGAGVRGGSVRE